MQLNPDDIYERLVKLGDDWAECNAAADILEESKKTLLAQLGAECDGSMAAKEAYALRHDDYGRHIRLMVETRKLANKAKVKYDSAKSWSELKRTEAANLRATERYST